MDFMYRMISVNIGGIRENNKRNLVISYGKKNWIPYFSILLETHVNFSHLNDIRKLWDGEVIISPGKTQTCGVLVLAKKTASPMEQIITEPAQRHVFFKIKNTADAALTLYAPSEIMKERRIRK